MSKTTYNSNSLPQTDEQWLQSFLAETQPNIEEADPNFLADATANLPITEAKLDDMFELEREQLADDDWIQFMTETEYNRLACSSKEDFKIEESVPYTISKRNGCTIIVAGGIEVGKVYRIYEREDEGTDRFWTHSLANHSMRKMSKNIWKTRKESITDLITNHPRQEENNVRRM